MSQKVYFIDNKDYHSNKNYGKKNREYPNREQVMEILANQDHNSVSNLKNIKDEKLRATLRTEILNSWDFEDSDGKNGHCIIHNKDKVQDYNDLRGTIVDLHSGQVVCRPFGLQVDFVQDELSDEVSPGQVTLYHDERSQNIHEKSKYITVPLKELEIYIGFEGATVNIWKDLGGHIHISSMKKIDMNKSMSRWNGSLPYDEIWRQLGGPDPHLLFDEGEMSPFVYSFLMSHPDLFCVTKLMSVGILVYLGCRKMDITYPEGHKVTTKPKHIETISDLAKYKEHKKSNGSDSKLIFYSPAPLDLATANHHLKYGFYKQWDMKGMRSQQGTGEFLMIKHVGNENNEYAPVYRIMSEAYSWRMELRSHQHMICNAFRLYSCARSKKYFVEGLFPCFHEQSKAELLAQIQKGIPILRYRNDGPKIGDHNVWERLENIWLAYILAVPVSLQQQAYDSLARYEQMLKDGATKVISIANTPHSDYTCAAEARNVYNVIELPPPSDDDTQEQHTIGRIVQYFRFKMVGHKVYKLIKDIEKNENMRSRQGEGLRL